MTQGATATKSTRIFEGPYHASHLVEYTSHCPYAFKLRHIENAPERWRNAKALLGDAVHYVLERIHELEGTEHQIPEDCPVDVADRLLAEVWPWLVQNGNPRYPERAGLPVFWGRRMRGPLSEVMTQADFEGEWWRRACDWIAGYASKRANRNTGASRTTDVEVGFRLLLGDRPGAKTGYPVLGRFDQIREYVSMEDIPQSLYQMDRFHPGVISELKARLGRNGKLVELSDWKTIRERPIFMKQADPWVTMKREYQPRLYSLAMAEGEIGEIQRTLEPDGSAREEFISHYAPGRAPDFYTWHWLPGYQPREKGNRREQYKGKRFTASNPEPSDLYEPLEAPGDPLMADPRISVIVYEKDLEATRKDVRRVIAAMRMGHYYRVPGKYTCTCCRFTEECALDMDVPLITKDMVPDDFEEGDAEFYGV